MPRLRPELADSVFYLYRRNPKTGAIEGPCGTGSIVGRRSRVPVISDYYGVSNYHLTNDLGASIVRLNTKDGGSRLLEYGPEDWHFPPGGDDLSMVDLSDDIHPDTDKLASNGDWSFITEEIIRRYEIGPGEDVFMIGMFAEHPGGQRNRPAARFGNLSLVADRDAPVKQPHGITRPSHLVDMRSRSGFSGSPVLIYRVPTGDLTSPMLNGDFVDDIGFITAQKVSTRKEWFLGLLGVHCGQFNDLVEVRTSPRTERLGDPIHEGDKLYIQSGMTIVVPAWRINELWNLEVFQMARRGRDEKRPSEDDKRPQGESVLAASDDNPTHREHFNSLLSAAARKPAQGD